MKKFLLIFIALIVIKGCQTNEVLEEPTPKFEAETVVETTQETEKEVKGRSGPIFFQYKNDFPRFIWWDYPEYAMNGTTYKIAWKCDPKYTKSIFVNDVKMDLKDKIYVKADWAREFTFLLIGHSGKNDKQTIFVPIMVH